MSHTNFLVKLNNYGTCIANQWFEKYMSDGNLSVELDKIKSFLIDIK